MEILTGKYELNSGCDECAMHSYGEFLLISAFRAVQFECYDWDSDGR